MSLTVIMHLGMMSRLLSLTVHASFLHRYSSSSQTPKSFISFQNNLYKRCRFSSLAGCGPQAPLRKSGGNSITQGAQRQCGQWFSPRRAGTLAFSLYPRGCRRKVSIDKYQRIQFCWMDLPVKLNLLVRLIISIYIPCALLHCGGWRPLVGMHSHLSLTTELGGLFCSKNRCVLATKASGGVFVHSTVTYKRTCTHICTYSLICWLRYFMCNTWLWLTFITFWSIWGCLVEAMCCFSGLR